MFVVYESQFILCISVRCRVDDETYLSYMNIVSNSQEYVFNNIQRTKSMVNLKWMRRVRVWPTHRKEDLSTTP
jgi:hypothetical protein